MAELKYKRVLLKLSGEALAGEKQIGIDPHTVSKICAEIADVVDMGLEVALVIGGGLSLLASSNPIGTVFSALFISHISVGGSFLSTKFYPTEISDLISGSIIYLCAFSMLFRGKIQKLLFKNADKTNVNAEPAPAAEKTKKEGK